MDTITNPDVAQAFSRYPDPLRQKLLGLRRLILQTALETDGVGTVEETLKWNEPSYRAKGGSPVRVSAVKNSRDRYAMYFVCTTSLAETFKTLHADQFTFQGNRAIVFDLDDEVPVDALKHCIVLALTYHSRKHLPMLGAVSMG